ncbi:MAG: hypothetical protein R3D62_02885 [Xanthobacteraceae bacterium]
MNTVLCRLLARIAGGHWRTRDFTLERLRAALRAYIVHFPVSHLHQRQPCLGGGSR